MLQIDHIYEFLYQEIFKDFECCCLPNGVLNKKGNIKIHDISIFTPGLDTTKKIIFYDQEPFIEELVNPYMDLTALWFRQYSIEEIRQKAKNNDLPYGIRVTEKDLDFILLSYDRVYKKSILVTSEHSTLVNDYVFRHELKSLYYFFHGFAALDWYRGYYTLNYNKQIVKSYTYDFITFNRIITNDRSYRIYFVSKLAELELLDQGQVSFNVTDNLFVNWRDEVSDPNSKLSLHAKRHTEQYLINFNKLAIDHAALPGSASADIPRTIDSWMNPTSVNKRVDIDSFWHIVTETVFYYDKLHLTEKIFKPIVSKQPFMLLAAPGNLAYLKSYGFKTFDSVIDESYDNIQDNDLRTEAVVGQLHWYCNLTPDEKTDIIRQLEPIIDYNFHHFYGEFKHIITRELLDNTKALFQSIGYDDSHINYDNIHHVLTH